MSDAGESEASPFSTPELEGSRSHAAAQRRRLSSTFAAALAGMTLLAVGLLGALATAGGGSDGRSGEASPPLEAGGDPPSAALWTHEANEACARSAARIEESVAGAEALGPVLAVRTATLEQLAELEVPEAALSEYRLMLHSWRHSIGQSRAALAAATSGDEAALAGALRRAGRSSEEGGRLALALGLEGCAALFAVGEG